MAIPGARLVIRFSWITTRSCACASKCRACECSQARGSRAASSEARRLPHLVRKRKLVRESRMGRCGRRRRDDAMSKKHDYRCRAYRSDQLLLCVLSLQD
jgi:hypothetical protein